MSQDPQIMMNPLGTIMSLHTFTAIHNDIIKYVSLDQIGGPSEWTTFDFPRITKTHQWVL